MGRPRTFDEAGVLHAATDVFWRNGYDATSTRDLCAAVGLDRSSVYNAFGSKRGLFVRALEGYLDERAERQRALVEDTAAPVPARIGALLAAVVDDEEHGRVGRKGRGCFAVNTVVELAGRDEGVFAALEADTARRLAALRDVLAVGQAAGEIADRRTPEAMARFVNATIAGIRIAAQGGTQRAGLEEIAATALDALRH